jgi:hypothetical protein
VSVRSIQKRHNLLGYAMQQMTKKEKRMLTNLDVKAAVATERTVGILETACRLGNKNCIRHTTSNNARRRSHALD